MVDDSIAVYVEAPDVVGFGNEVWLFGYPTAAWLPSRSRPDSVAWLGFSYVGIRRSTTGTVRLVPAPAGHHAVEAPRAVVHRGRLHLVWAAPSGRREVDSLFHAEWLGTRWSAPSVVATGGAWEWGRTTASHLLARNDTLFVAAPGGSAADQFASLLRRAGGRWAERRIPSRSFLSYTALALTPRELVLIEIGIPDSMRPGEHRQADLRPVLQDRPQRLPTQNQRPRIDQGVHARRARLLSQNGQLAQVFSAAENP